VIHVLAAADDAAATAFIELGAVVLGLAVLARIAGRIGMPAIPLYLLAGLVVGDGGFAVVDVSEDFIELAGQIGVLLLLFTLGLEYTSDELRHGLRSGWVAGVLDAAANFAPGFGTGLLLGWDPTTAALLGGVTWVSSSGIVAKVLTDLHRLGNRETPSVLGLLVFEDLAMALYLPIVGALVARRGAGETVVTVAVALVAVGLILALAMRGGKRLSALLAPASNESLLLAVFGLTLLVAGLAEEVQVSSAIGAFLVGLALSGAVQERTTSLIEPLRDLFAATFFLSFAFQVHASSLLRVLWVAGLLAVVTAATKLLSGWVAAARQGVAPRGRVRAGTALIARGEFSIVIASLGVGLADGRDLGAVAAAYVLVTAVLGPVAARFADRVPLPARRPVPARV
jgi:CPA2 family monovalent cation:H+ antiporter-2